MDFVRDGVRLHVIEEGKGEPLVLLHGHSLDLTVWDAQAPAWAAAGWRVIRYDQRGHGQSVSPPCGYRWGDHAADAAALLRARDAAPAHVVGLSKGGGIAVELALRSPELVRSMVLVGPLLPDYPLSAELVDSFRRFARAIRAGGVARAVREVWLGHPLIASAAAHPEVGARLVAMIGRFPAGEYLAASRDEPDRDWNAVERLGEIAAPTTVIGGELDVPDFAAMARLAAERIPGARLEVVTGCGHLVPVERAGETTSLVLAHLARAVGAAAAARAVRRPWSSI
jgi:pimeloyl-ACP methyl ester carboxylesterase